MALSICFYIAIKMTIKEEVLINASQYEIRVALIAQGRLQELYFEQSLSRGLVGNIFKAKVVRVLPGMQAAFVDLGLDKNGFLHARDILRLDHKDSQKIPSIEKLVRQGETVMVQVVKDPVGDKGASLTMHISIPSRNLVYLPYGKNIGISQQITNSEERKRLTNLLTDLQQKHQIKGGFIIRTSTESVINQQLDNDVNLLNKLWQSIQIDMKNAKKGSQIYEDLPLELRVMRDFMHLDIERVIIDSQDAFDKVCNFSDEFIPEMRHKLEKYDAEQPLFNKYEIEQEIDKSLDRKVLLESGSFLVIDQAEAMTTIDVNTGSYVGNKNDGETFLQTNLEAATEIARQLRIRNLGGIIVIDFINMQKGSHKKQVLLALESALSKDRVNIEITDMSPLGLVEITRRRVRQSLEQLMCEPCQVCDGKGTVKTIKTVCYEILREVMREDGQYKSRAYTIVAAPRVIDFLSDDKISGLDDLQKNIARPINLQVEKSYSQEQYDIILN